MGSTALPAKWVTPVSTRASAVAAPAARPDALRRWRRFPRCCADCRSSPPAAETPTTVEQLIERLRDGNLGAEQTVEEAGEAIGTMIATLCNVLNPRHVIVGGMIVEASDELLTVIRTTVYRRARPLTTRNLTIGRSPLGRFNGLAGALVLATDRALSAEHLFD
ncbi:ROK family protein [Bifidobacterium oedipodis]|uniref:ROK family protein n=1 Tax=Bifidobacterium oedipodis TaxID=2675322 RepID=UPI001F0DA2A8|nr:ROK family protein [Bifidobacterium sp. DSM 109957]